MRIKEYEAGWTAAPSRQDGPADPDAAMETLVRVGMEPYWDPKAPEGPVLFRPARGAKGPRSAEADRDRRWRPEVIQALGLTSEKQVASVRTEVRRRVARSP
jgi:hypothetical protein